MKADLLMCETHLSPKVSNSGGFHHFFLLSKELWNAIECVIDKGKLKCHYFHKVNYSQIFNTLF
jgi:hypothetical protein